MGKDFLQFNSLLRLFLQESVDQSAAFCAERREAHLIITLNLTPALTYWSYISCTSSGIRNQENLMQFLTAIFHKATCPCFVCLKWWQNSYLLTGQFWTRGAVWACADLSNLENIRPLFWITEPPVTKPSQACHGTFPLCETQEGSILLCLEEKDFIQCASSIHKCRNSTVYISSASRLQVIM